MAEYRPRPGVRWAVEPWGILLIDEHSGATRVLNYPHAAVWDLITRGEPLARIVAKLVPIAGLTPEAAEALATELQESLCAEGFLEREAPRG